MSDGLRATLDNLDRLMAEADGASLKLASSPTYVTPLQAKAGEAIGALLNASKELIAASRAWEAVMVARAKVDDEDGTLWGLLEDVDHIAAEYRRTGGAK